MTTRCALAALALLVGVAGCATFDVQSDFSRRADFGRYLTFDWFPQPQTAEWDLLSQSPPLRDQVRTAVQRELSAKGVRLQPGEATDVLIAPRLMGKGNADDGSWGYGLGHWARGATSGG
jgi:hypothetical protein